MRPQVYGDPRNPARVSRGSSLHTNGGRFGQPQSFTYQPGRGAGATRVQRQQPATTEGLERQVDRADQLAAAGRTDNATRTGRAARAAYARRGGRDGGQGSDARVADRGALEAEAKSESESGPEKEPEAEPGPEPDEKQPRAGPAVNGPNGSYPVGPLIDPAILSARRQVTAKGGCVRADGRPGGRVPAQAGA